MLAVLVDSAMRENMRTQSKSMEVLEKIAKYTDRKLKLLEEEEKRKTDMARRMFNGHSQYCGCSICM